MIVPINDPRDLAQRLEGKSNIPETVPAPAIPFKIGESKKFWITNVDTNKNFQVTAVLRYITPHLYFWIEDGITYKETDLQRLAETFETKIYSTNRKFFGSEWTPGIDNDSHLYILYAKNAGANLAGYFSSSDAVHPLAHEYSNAHELFLVNADTSRLSDAYTYGVLAHEFQHMIHWYQDRNEETWLNEGFSELAAFLNDMGGDDKVPLFFTRPDLQLNDWPNDNKATSPHYGAAFLFVNYFLGRFGDSATQAVVSQKENGFDSIDKVLSQKGIKDPKTGKLMTADQIFTEWVVANLLQDKSVDDGRYAYPLIRSMPKPSIAETISRCPLTPGDRTVSQFGADYIRITCQGTYTLNFEGVREVGVLPANPYSGKYAFWSNKGDESNMTLTQTFDFTKVTGPITIKYSTWYDLEEDYDYTYLVASTDGQGWQILKTPFGTAEDPSGNSYGWGYNGKTKNWIQESVDLSQFAGKKVTLRFEYVTDAAVNGEGFLLDDIEIPQINYKTDFEKDQGGWEGAGFVRIQNRLPQTYKVTLVRRGKTTEVETISLSNQQAASIQLNISGDLREVVVIVSGSTRFTRLPAKYRIGIQ
jgi:hypothetical protein